MDAGRVIRPLQAKLDEVKADGLDVMLCSTEIIENVISLLKEQVPLEPYACEGDMKCGNGCEIVGYIRESDGNIERLTNYCPYCGRPVKWD